MIRKNVKNRSQKRKNWSKKRQKYVRKTSKYFQKRQKMFQKALVVVTSSSANLSVVDSLGSANLSQITLSCQSVDQNGCNSNQSPASVASVHVYNLKPDTAYTNTAYTCVHSYTNCDFDFQ